MNRPLVHFSTTSWARSRKAITECHSTYSFSPNLFLVAMRNEAALSLAPKNAASAPRLPVRITRLLLKDFRCCLFCALLVAVLRVEFLAVLMMISPVPLSRIDFFVHLGASRKKQPQNEDRGQCRERGRPKGESKLTDNTVFRWREGCIPRRPEEPAMQAEARERIGWET